MHGLTVEDARRLKQQGGGRLRLCRNRNQSEKKTDGEGTVYRHGVIISQSGANQLVQAYTRIFGLIA
jgi:hypothetical protein